MMDVWVFQAADIIRDSLQAAHQSASLGSPQQQAQNHSQELPMGGEGTAAARARIQTILQESSARLLKARGLLGEMCRNPSVLPEPPAAAAAAARWVGGWTRTSDSSCSLGGSSERKTFRSVQPH